MISVFTCMICGRLYSRDPRASHLEQSELQQLLEIEKAQTDHISHGLGDCCKDIPTSQWSGVSKAKLINEVMKP